MEQYRKPDPRKHWFDVVNMTWYSPMCSKNWAAKAWELCLERILVKYQLFICKRATSSPKYFS